MNNLIGWRCSVVGIVLQDPLGAINARIWKSNMIVKQVFCCGEIYHLSPILSISIKQLPCKKPMGESHGLGRGLLVTSGAL